MLRGGVVMARDDDAALAGLVGNGAAMLGREVGGPGLATLDIGGHLGVGEALLALVVGLVGVERGELALARRVVHERDQADAGVLLEIAIGIEHVGRGNLTAQVDEMVG